MALRPAPKRNSVDYQKLDELQKEIFGSEARRGGETRFRLAKPEGNPPPAKTRLQTKSSSAA